ncbi:succinyldiaminopimelate desuccinylase [Faunimonas pinastri]|uniref:Succinyl-diaminopimelate desuccinylase n=1 Tax=Faunimonas pinastri TaxID=1855383 RepID=A0A1H9HFG3_9HYPH|nr:succinyl-diaminopimelate desuccinylase [Faunimonas pinastri]SEQ61055.1 succinyldiaminopimelate desuccinylase [Faunimonas pinastri]
MTPTVQAILTDLIRAESVTPDAGPAIDALCGHLAPAGFTIERPVFSEPNTPDVENLFAAVGTGERHLVLAGHVDVVPTGPASAWRHPPFSAAVEDGVLYGRGAVDMKGGLAAMTAAALRFVERRGPHFGGRISFLVTGDEEGPALNGTVKLLDWAVERGERFTASIVGEPTSARELGDQVKVGRRGSYSLTLTVEGRQGHAAYPHLADNPVRGLTQILQALLAAPLDNGTDRFEPSTFEIVGLDTGNAAWNVIPGNAWARINSRYNDKWTRETLRTEIERRIREAIAGDSPTRANQPIRWRVDEEPGNADAFVTRDDALVSTLSEAITAVTGRQPELSTGGGTSDARFIKNFCPVVEFGPVGQTMHQVDERVPVAELEETARIYETFLDAFFPA